MSVVEFSTVADLHAAIPTMTDRELVGYVMRLLAEASPEHDAVADLVPLVCEMSSRLLQVGPYDVSRRDDPRDPGEPLIVSQP